MVGGWIPTELRTSRKVTRVLRNVRQKPLDAGISGNSGSGTSHRAFKSVTQIHIINLL